MWTAQEMRDLRRRLGWSQWQLGAAIGWSQSVVSRLERGLGQPNETFCRQLDELVQNTTVSNL